MCPCLLTMFSAFKTCIRVIEWFFNVEKAVRMKRNKRVKNRKNGSILIFCTILHFIFVVWVFYCVLLLFIFTLKSIGNLCQILKKHKSKKISLQGIWCLGRGQNRLYSIRFLTAWVAESRGNGLRIYPEVIFFRLTLKKSFG